MPYPVLGAFIAFAAVAAAEERIPVAFTAPDPRPPAATEPPGGSRIDFRFAPPRWQTSICLPDDPAKTLVDSEGRLLYEYGGGPYDGFRTRVTVRLADSAGGPFRQSLADPRAPIVTTESAAGDLALAVEAFAEAPPTAAEGPAEPAAILERLDGDDSIRGWATPNVPCDPVFWDVAVGWNRSLEYRFRADSRRPYIAVFGFCEGWWSEPGKRVLELRVEGRAVRTVDAAAKPGKNVPFVVMVPAADEDGDGWIRIEVAAAPGAADANTVLNALWIFDAGRRSKEADIIAGTLTQPPVAAATAAMAGERVGPGGRARADLAIARAANRGSSPRPVPLRVLVESTRKLAISEDRRTVLKDGRPFLAVEPPAASAEAREKSILLDLGAPEVAPGKEREVALTALIGSDAVAVDAVKAAAERRRAAAYWKALDLPWDRIRVPDPGVQALLDSSIRNIYQAREVKRGLPAFQVGPTCYRGLWVVDGSFLMEAVSYLGRLEEARSGIEYLLTFQRPDGSVQIIPGHWKETGIALWVLSRHAQLTGDRAWLEKRWPQVARMVGHVKDLRVESRKDPAAPEAGLIPRGFSDGGLSGPAPEYTNVYWTLVGLRAIAGAARWLGKPEADAWAAEYEDFLAAYRRAAARDAKTDDRGNRYVPIVMTGGPAASPQRAQWGFLHAVFPGKVFERDDPIATGTLAMLTGTEREGLIFGTGWLEHGIWNYAGSFYAHAHLWMGGGRKAGEVLYAYGNHASPLLCWREEQSPRGGTDVVGDMPHNWASAEWVRLLRHLAVLERGNELHLLEGIPAAWARSGGDLRLREVATEFGPVSLDVAFAAGGRSARIRVVPPARTPPAKVAVHLESWAAPGSRLAAAGRPLDPARPDLSAAPGEPLELEVVPADR